VRGRKKRAKKVKLEREEKLKVSFVRSGKSQDNKKIRIKYEWKIPRERKTNRHLDPTILNQFYVGRIRLTPGSSLGNTDKNGEMLPGGGGTR